MDNTPYGTVPASTSDEDRALSKQELRHIYPHLFEAWYADLDPWNRGMIFASHFKKYLS